MKPLSLDQRLQDLADHVTKDLALLKEYEDALRYEDEPRRQARYRQEIEQLGQSANRYQQEYNELLKQVTEQTVKMQTVAAQMQQMDEKLNLVLSSQVAIYQNLGEMRQALLSRYAVTERSLIAAVTQQLNQHQLAVTQTLLDALEANQLSEPEMERMLEVLEERLPELPSIQARVVEIVKAPQLDTRHKLKVTLPIVPFLVDYEGELELGSGFNVKTAWKWFVAKLRKQSTGNLLPRDNTSFKPIWQLAQELTQDITEEELRQLPKDGAVQHDHYIYGTPKVD